MNPYNYQMNPRVLITLLLLATCGGCAWQSKLFPENGGAFAHQTHVINGTSFRLPDFSNVGYGEGKTGLPPRSSILVATSLSPLPGDNTAHIQHALNEVGLKPGMDTKAVLLTKGVYPVSDEIYIPSRVVLRGEGPGNTKIVMTKKENRKKVILAAFRSYARDRNPRSANWFKRPIDGKYYPLLRDIQVGETVISTQDVGEFKVNEFVVVKNTVTPDFVKAYHQGNLSYKAHDGASQAIWRGERFSIRYIRKVVAIDRERGTLTIDAPVRHALKVRDKSYVMHLPESEVGREIGIEDLSVGYVMPKGNARYRDVNSHGKDSRTHKATAIYFGNVIGGWVRNVRSFAHSGNDNDDLNLLSNGIRVQSSRFITIEDVVMRNPLNIGGGGNGYLFHPSSANDILITRSRAYNGRHNFSFGFVNSGVVISEFQSFNSALAVDFHTGLNHQNLLERIDFFYEKPTWNNNVLEMHNRQWKSSGAGLTGIDNVLFGINIFGPDELKVCLSDLSSTIGKNYAIGVQNLNYSNGLAGRACNLPPATGLWAENNRPGKAKKLQPYSLYQEQRKTR